MSGYTLRIAPEGVDARKGGRGMTVTTDDPVLKVKTRQEPPHFDTVPYEFDEEPAEGITELVRIPHHYGYTPLTIAQFSQDAETYYIMPFTYEIDLGTGDLKGFRCRADDTNVYITLRRVGVGNSLLGVTVYFKYSIYAESPL